MKKTRIISSDDPKIGATEVLAFAEQIGDENFVMLTQFAENEGATIGGLIEEISDFIEANGGYETREDLFLMINEWAKIDELPVVMKPIADTTHGVDRSLDMICRIALGDKAAEQLKAEAKKSGIPFAQHFVDVMQKSANLNPEIRKDGMKFIKENPPSNN